MRDADMPTAPSPAGAGPTATTPTAQQTTDSETTEKSVAAPCALPSQPQGQETRDAGWWWDFCHRLFPNSRPMTREERREVDAHAWADLEPITFTDDEPPPSLRMRHDFAARVVLVGLAVLACGMAYTAWTHGEPLATAVFALLSLTLSLVSQQEVG